MHFNLSDEQKLIRNAVDKFIRNDYKQKPARQGRFDPQLQRMNALQRTEEDLARFVVGEHEFGDQPTSGPQYPNQEHDADQPASGRQNVVGREVGGSHRLRVVIDHPHGELIRPLPEVHGA